MIYKLTKSCVMDNQGVGSMIGKEGGRRRQTPEFEISSFEIWGARLDVLPDMCSREIFVWRYMYLPSVYCDLILDVSLQ